MESGYIKKNADRATRISEAAAKKQARAAEQLKEKQNAAIEKMEAAQIIN